MKSFIIDVEKFFEGHLLYTQEGDLQIESNGCTYNFNRDTDIRCLTNALCRALTMGTRELAFDVYFAFAEIFKIFDSSNDRVDILIETLMEYEENSGRLVERHRDHYVHSVYIFALGLVFFENNAKYRNAYMKFYGYTDVKEAKRNFLYDWGMCSLFHDIGYPFEMTHLQLTEYANKLKFECSDTSENGRISYQLKMCVNNPEAFGEITQNSSKIKSFVAPDGECNVNNILAYDIAYKLGLDYPSLKELVICRIKEPKHSIDHAYFGAVILFKTLLNNSSDSFLFTRHHIDICSAIYLHNSIYKYDIADKLKEDKKQYAPLKLMQHPLAFLLLLCDELQCWDRTAYGKTSKKEVLPFDFHLRVNDDSAVIKYRFSEEEVIKYEGALENKCYDSILHGSMAKKIAERVVDYTEIAYFKFLCEFKDKPQKPDVYLSASKYVSLYRFAIAINESYVENCEKYNVEGMKKNFLNLALEYKLSNIAQARSYAKKLDKIQCFFSDAEMDYERVEQFSDMELDLLAREEHIRWVQEKLEMGWMYGTEYQNRAERENKRIHKDIVPYDELIDTQKDKDIYPIKNMIKILNEFANGVHIYRLFKSKPHKKVAFTGHRTISNPEKIYQSIESELKRLKKLYQLEAVCMFAAGSDTLFAKAAIALGISIRAALPKPVHQYIAEDFSQKEKADTMALLAQTSRCDIYPRCKFTYQGASRHLLKGCDILLCVWDGVELPLEDHNKNKINQGGTYYNISCAKKNNVEVIAIDAEG